MSFISDYLLITPASGKIDSTSTQIAPFFSQEISKPNKTDPIFSKITSLSNKMNIKSQILGQLIILIYLSPATTPHKQVAYCQKPVASRQPPNYPPINSFSGIRSCSVYLPSSKVATKFLLIW